jgi:hypothetical protein
VFNEAKKHYAQTAGGWNVEATVENDDYILMDIQASTGDDTVLSEVFFFPTETGVIENAEHQKLSQSGAAIGSGGYRLTIARPRMLQGTPDRLVGVLVCRTGWGRGGFPAMYIDIPLKDVRN